MVHRGPDGEGYYEDPDIALAHRRLSIIDLEGGRQPIANEDESVVLVCNGEIYNSPALRRELERRGHRFRTRTDVEVILHLYEEQGTECVRALRGMFAFAIWDRPRRLLVLARDHMGQKPLFYVRRGREMWFASEVKALTRTGVVAPEIDLDGLWHYVSLRFLPDRYSLFRGVTKLPAATVLTFSEGETEEFHYWQPGFRPKRKGGPADLVDELDDLLRSTVSMHTLSDVRVGAFLSGGIDSSTVAAMMAGQAREAVPTFSIGVQEQDYNELPFARMVARRYGMEAHERVVRADLIHLIPSMIYHLDEPSDPFGVGVYLVSGLAREHVKVCLGGDGGDESFAGYDRFLGQRLVDLYCLLPAWFRRQVVRRITDRIPESFGYKSLAQKAAWMNEMSLYSAGERYARSMSFLRFTQDAKQRLFTQAARGRIDDYDSTAKILRYFDADSVDDLVDRMLYTDLMTRMPDHLLSIVDRMSMAHSLESRSPLVDHRVVDFAASLPGDMKLRGRQLKYALKQVAARYLPRELIHRRKQGFGFPLGSWMRTELRDFMGRLFARSRFIERGLFEGSYIRQLLDEHMAGRRNHDFRLWILLNLEIWHRLNLEGMDVGQVGQEIEELLAG